MTIDLPGLTERELKALMNVCIQSAFSDGALSELERNEIRRIAEKNGSPDLTAAYQIALGGTTPLSQMAGELSTAEAKRMAYEMAVCICNVDGAINTAEQTFLNNLRRALNLDSQSTGAFQQSATAIGEVPPMLTDFTKGKSHLDELIRDRAILTGALELMPHTLATMAIVPVQLRMVYQIGKELGYELDLAHTKEFLATVGVGLTSQAVEGYLGKIVGQITRGFAGRVLGGLASQAVESAVAFATTYAIGQVAKSYYESGRTLSTAQLRDLFATLLTQGRSMQSQFSSQISQRAGSLKVSDFIPLVRS